MLMEFVAWLFGVTFSLSRVLNVLEFYDRLETIGKGRAEYVSG